MAGDQQCLWVGLGKVRVGGGAAAGTASGPRADPCGDGGRRKKTAGLPGIGYRVVVGPGGVWAGMEPM